MPRFMGCSENSVQRKSYSCKCLYWEKKKNKTQSNHLIFYHKKLGKKKKLNSTQRRKDIIKVSVNKERIEKQKRNKPKVGSLHSNY